MSDRKYRHRGYQDSDREERQPRRPQHGPGEGPGRHMEGAPRGRGVGLPTEVAFKCAVCGQEVRNVGEIAFDAPCRSCGKPLHTCTNCMFFDPGARFECRKPISQRVESKAKANECGYFQPKTVRDLSSRAPASPADARAAFDALFKK